MQKCVKMNYSSSDLGDDFTFPVATPTSISPGISYRLRGAREESGEPQRAGSGRRGSTPASGWGQRGRCCGDGGFRHSRRVPDRGSGAGCTVGCGWPLRKEKERVRAKKMSESRRAKSTENKQHEKCSKNSLKHMEDGKNGTK